MRPLSYVASVALGLLLSCQQESPLQSAVELELQNSPAAGLAARTLEDMHVQADQRYIVQFRPGAEPVGSRAAAVLERLGRTLPAAAENRLSLLHVYDKALAGMTVHGPRGLLARFAADPAVLSVALDQVIVLEAKPVKPPRSSSSAVSSSSALSSSATAGRQPIPWGVQRVQGPSTATSYQGIAFIIDTGIDTTHPDLNVLWTRGKSCIAAEPSLNDSNGHGTHVAGIIGAYDNADYTVGVVPGVAVVPVKVLNKSGSGYISDVICGVDYVAQQANASGQDVANMSLGGSANTMLDLAVYNASAAARFVLSAGNAAKPASLYSPARVNNANRVFTISAMDAYDVFAYFSNYGNPPVDYAAPGVSILSLYKHGGTATMSGTSMAAPHFAGILLHAPTFATDGTVSGDRDRNPDAIAVLHTP